MTRPAGHTGVATALPLDNAAATRAAFRLVFPGVMVAMFVASVDQTILATTLPAIGATFGDLADVSWVAIAYLLAATVTAPIHGYLGDVPPNEFEAAFYAAQQTAPTGVGIQ